MTFDTKPLATTCACRVAVGTSHADLEAGVAPTTSIGYCPVHAAAQDSIETLRRLLDAIQRGVVSRQFDDAYLAGRAHLAKVEADAVKVNRDVNRPTAAGRVEAVAVPVWKCPQCGSERITVRSRHAGDPAEDRVECDQCRLKGKRYDFAWPRVNVVAHECQNPENCGICHECQRSQPCPVHGARP
jgi:hypothetical protein